MLRAGRVGHPDTWREGEYVVGDDHQGLGVADWVERQQETERVQCPVFFESNKYNPLTMNKNKNNYSHGFVLGF
jgi:hypothetical protein